MHFLIDFCAHRLVLQRGSTPVRPIKTVVLWTYDDFLRIAFGMCFASEKPFKNLPKPPPNDDKIQTKNVLVFYIDFFQVLAPILGALGPPSWSQVGPKHAP